MLNGITLYYTGRRLKFDLYSRLLLSAFAWISDDNIFDARRSPSTIQNRYTRVHEVSRACQSSDGIRGVFIFIDQTCGAVVEEKSAFWKKAAIYLDVHRAATRLNPSLVSRCRRDGKKWRRAIRNRRRSSRDALKVIGKRVKKCANGMRAGYEPATPRVESRCTQSNRAIAAAAAAYLFSFSIFGPTKDNPPRLPSLRRVSLSSAANPLSRPTCQLGRLSRWQMTRGGRRWSARTGPWSSHGIQRTTFRERNTSGWERGGGFNPSGCFRRSGVGSTNPREDHDDPRSESLRLTRWRSACRSGARDDVDTLSGGLMLWTVRLAKYVEINRPFDASSETGKLRYTYAHVSTWLQATQVDVFLRLILRYSIPKSSVLVILKLYHTFESKYKSFINIIHHFCIYKNVIFIIL